MKKGESPDPEMVARLTAAARLANTGRKRPDPRITTLKRGTWPEQVMAAILEHACVEFEAHQIIDGLTPDFYLPKSRSVVEVDGVYWHRDRSTEERDQRLLDAGVSYVWHITDQQLFDLGWPAKHARRSR